MQNVLFVLKTENLWYVQTNDPGGKKLLDLLDILLGRYHHIRLIVAHSSGEGINEKNKVFYTKLDQFDSNIVSLTNFSEGEARDFIDANNLNEMDFNQLKRMTNFNPLLLQKVNKTKKQYWKSKYDDVFEQHLLTSVLKEIESHTISTFDVAYKKSRIDFLQRLSDTDYFLYYAKH